MKKNIRVLAFLLALTLLLSTVACGGKTPEQSSAGEETPSQSQEASGAEDNTESTDDPLLHPERYGGHADIRSATAFANGPDPLRNLSLWKYQYLLAVFEGPLSRDADNNIVPGVCNYTHSDDWLTITMTVREGKKFTNGDTVDIYDVEASLKRAFARHASQIKYVVPYLESMTVNDADQSLTLKFTEYNERIMYYLAAYRPWEAVMPKEICEKYMEEGSYIMDVADCIGTCGYVYEAFVDREVVTLRRADNWEVFRSDEYTGVAGTHWNYLDSISYWYCSDDGAAALAVISKNYDCVEAIPADYMDMAKSSGIKETVLPSDVGTGFYFNVDGAAQNNVCARYPSLRKAVMAAIDYAGFLEVISDNQEQVLDCPWTDTNFKTDVWLKADYYGDVNMDVVNKYKDLAKAEGWDGVEPVVMIRTSSRNDIPTLFKGYMEDAGIPVDIQLLDGNAVSEKTKNDPANSTKFDIFFNWPTYSPTPVTRPSEMTAYWTKDEKYTAFFDKMEGIPTDDPEYRKLFNELNEYMVDTCGWAYLSTINWYWYTPEEFIINEEGLNRYFFNSYWTDPENHPRK